MEIIIKKLSDYGFDEIELINLLNLTNWDISKFHNYMNNRHTFQPLEPLEPLQIDTTDCLICYDSIDLNCPHTFYSEKCGHVFCIQCYSSHL